MKKKMHAGILNERKFFRFICKSIEEGISNFCFKGQNGKLILFKGITSASHITVPTRRSRGFCNKGDIILFDDVNGIEYPISIKLSETKTSWESSDFAHKHELIKFIECYGKINIPKGIKIRIYSDEDLSKYVFGDDIIQNKGCVIIQTFDSCKYHKYNEKTILIECYRMFPDVDSINQDEYYKPVITVRSDAGRNTMDPLIGGYRVEVVPIHTSTEITKILEDLNEI